MKRKYCSKSLILLVTTATVERAFSAMSIVKTELRNKMNDEWMNHLLVCYIERVVFASIDDIKIIQCYQKMRKRKGLLPRGLRVNGKICFFANFHMNN